MAIGFFTFRFSLFTLPFLKGYIQSEGDVQRNGVTIVRILGIHTCEAAALDGEQVLSAEVEAQALHGELLCEALRYVVANLHGAQLEIRTVLHPIA